MSAVPEDKEIGENEGCGEPLSSERKSDLSNSARSVRHKHDGHIHAVVTFNFSRNEVVLLTPLIRRVWHTGRIAVCRGAEELRSRLTSKDVLLCNGQTDFYELDGAFLIAQGKGVQATACIFSSGVNAGSLECARINGANVILAGLENEEELSDCERSIAEGRRFWSKGSFATALTDTKCFATYYGGLSGMERIVCTDLLMGKPHKDIALRLGVKIQTVDTYTHRLLKKFGVSSAVELARMLAGKNL